MNQPPDAIPMEGELTTWVLAALAALVLYVGFGRRWYRLDPRPNRPMAIDPPTGFACFLAMYILGWIGGSIAAAVAAGDRVVSELHRWVLIATGANVGRLMVTGFYAQRVMAAPALPDDRRPGHLVAAGLGGLMLVLWWPLVQTSAWSAAVVSALVTGEMPSSIAHDTLQALVDSPRDAWFFLTVAMVTIATPLLEEVLYRGLLQETLRRLPLGPWVAVMLTSVLFAVMHLGAAAPHALVPLFVLSLGLGWAYEKTGRLATPFVMHALFNAANLAMAVSR